MALIGAPILSTCVFAAQVVGGGLGQREATVGASHLTLDPTRDYQPTGAPKGPKPKTKQTEP